MFCCWDGSADDRVKKVKQESQAIAGLAAEYLQRVNFKLNVSAFRLAPSIGELFVFIRMPTKTHGGPADLLFVIRNTPLGRLLWQPGVSLTLYYIALQMCAAAFGRRTSVFCGRRRAIEINIIVIRTHGLHIKYLRTPHD